MHRGRVRKPFLTAEGDAAALCCLLPQMKINHDGISQVKPLLRAGGERKKWLKGVFNPLQMKWRNKKNKKIKFQAVVYDNKVVFCLMVTFSD